MGEILDALAERLLAVTFVIAVSKFFHLAYFFIGKHRCETRSSHWNGLTNRIAAWEVLLQVGLVDNEFFKKQFDRDRY